MRIALKILFMAIFVLSNATFPAAAIENDSAYIQFATPPKIISKPELKFPDMAIKAGLADSIYIKVYIDKNGQPFKTVILKRGPEFVYMFDNQVRKWAMKIKFSPALDKDDQPVYSAVVIPVVFKLTGFQPPEVFEQPDPVYPEEALKMGIEGWVAVAVLVNPSGSPEGDASVIYREPFNTDVFDKAALDVARKTKFIPARSNGQYSYGWKFIKIEFRLSDK